MRAFALAITNDSPPLDPCGSSLAMLPIGVPGGAGPTSNPEATHSTRSWLHQRLNLRRSDSLTMRFYPRQRPAHLGFPVPRLCPMDLQKSCRAGFQPAVDWPAWHRRIHAKCDQLESLQLVSARSRNRWWRRGKYRTPMFRPATVASFLIPLAVPKVRAEVPVPLPPRARC